VAGRRLCQKRTPQGLCFGTDRKRPQRAWGSRVA